MESQESEKFSHPGITEALLKSLEMAVESDETDRKYGWYDGLWFAVKNSSAQEAGKSLGEGRSTVAAHLDRVRVTLIFVRHALAGGEYKADWGSSWKIATPGEAQWGEIKSGFRQEYEALRELIGSKPFWLEPGLAAAIHNIAHTAYPAGAVRQILKG